MPETARRIVLASRPVGEPKPSDFRLEEFPVPQPGPGQMLLRTKWLSLDPYMRGRMSDAPSYAKPVGIDEVMEAGTVSEVAASNNDKFAKGDIVLSRAGWQTHVLSDGSGLRKLDPNARAGLDRARRARHAGHDRLHGAAARSASRKAGETVVVSAASGAVGSVVGQIARIKGARAVGIAGGPDKCRYVKEELGFDDCVDHRAARLRRASSRPPARKASTSISRMSAAPVWDAVFPLLNPFARIPVCGLIAQYSATELPADMKYKTSQMFRAVLTKRLTIRGFIVTDFAARFDDFIRDVPQWIKEGRIKYREDIAEGLENAPAAFMGMLKGKNFGKQLVRVAE